MEAIQDDRRGEQNQAACLLGKLKPGQSFDEADVARRVARIGFVEVAVEQFNGLFDFAFVRGGLLFERWTD
jgi:hypothetical protein